MCDIFTGCIDNLELWCNEIDTAFTKYDNSLAKIKRLSSPLPHMKDVNVHWCLVDLFCAKNYINPDNYVCR
jgi:hypothetical protein